MKTIDFSYYIERYNAAEMSNSERLWFEKELEGNENLRKEVVLRKKTENILKKQDIIAMRNKLAAIEKLRKESVPDKMPKKQLIIRYAAGIAIFILFGSIIILLSNRNLSNSEIMEKYYTEYRPTTGQRSVSVELNEYFTQGLEYYETHDYKNAALFFSKVVQSEPKDMYATLLNGISNFEESKYSDAQKSFGTVIDDNKNLYIDQAQWYLALCYLQTGENIKAVQLLKVIRNEDGFYAKNAKKILRKIK